MGISSAARLGVVRKGELRWESLRLSQGGMSGRLTSTPSTQKKELNKPRQPQGLRV